MTDALGRTVWRVEADQVWAEDLAEIFRELWEVAALDDELATLGA